MTTLDKLYGSSDKKENKRGSALDALFEEEQQNIIQTAKMLEAQGIVTERQIVVEEKRQRLENLKRSAAGQNNGGFGGTGDGGTNTGVELIKFFVKQGLDLQKATEAVANMDPETIMKVAMFSGSNQMNQMMPFLMFSKKDTTSPKDIAEISKTYFELGKGAVPLAPVSPMKDLAEAIAILKPKDENADAMAYFNEKIEKMGDQITQEREARHQGELRHAEEMGRLRQENTDAQLKEIRAKLEEKDKDSTKDPWKYITDAKAKLTELGIVGAVATRSPMEEANELIGTVVNSPGMTRVFDAASQRIRERGPPGSPAAQAPQQPPRAGQTFFCDNCLVQGKRTPLTFTPELLAGTGSVKCPVCGNFFSMKQHGANPNPSGGGGPPSPPRNPPPGSF